MRISLRDNLSDVIGWTGQLEGQQRYAAAVALTRSTKAARTAMPGAASSIFDRGANRFTQQGFYSTVARKDKLEATVGVKDLQAEYLQYQIYGGDRFPHRKALKLPGQVKLDQFGNITRRTLQRLIEQARADRKAVRGRVGKSSYKGKSHGYFYGQPANRPELPPGIYMRVNTRTSRLIVPIVLFPAVAAHYKPRFDFYGIAAHTVGDRFRAAYDAAWTQALATVR